MADPLLAAGDPDRWRAGFGGAAGVRLCGLVAENNLPKLFVNADPGAILVGAQREFCRKWPNQTEITVTGSHFIQEDSGPEIGRAIAAWVVQNRVG